MSKLVTSDMPCISMEDLVNWLIAAKKMLVIINGTAHEHFTFLYFHIFNYKKPAGDVMSHLLYLKFRPYTFTITTFTDYRY